MAQEKEKLGAIYKELIDAMLPYQDKETGICGIRLKNQRPH